MKVLHVVVLAFMRASFQLFTSFKLAAFEQNMDGKNLL